ncbi:hypothetical protein XELAEV_18029244mg, partial [Xenopus laevis]
LRKEGRSKAGASTALAAIAHFSIAHGKIDITHSPVVRKIMKGWARVEGTRIDKREPIIERRLQLILRSLETVCLNKFECILFRATCALAFGGAFRISELVPPSKKALGKGLMLKHVVVQEEEVLVYIAKSKTDQLGRGKWVRIEKTVGVACPVRAVKEYMRVRPAGVQWFLIHEDLSPISAFQFRQVLKKAVVANGWDPSKFGSHSFRIGAATEAAMRGDKEERIKDLGRWRSRVFKKYIRQVKGKE